MKTIINGLRYDTDTATLIGEASYGMQGDFSAWWAELYRTPRSGRYFLAGHGGPMTRWANRHSDNSISGGEGILVLDADEALQWAEQNLTAEEVEAGFPDAIKDA